ncbi:MAG: ABC transporter ATP-binding protein [Limisphaerales bacterium]
MIQLTNVVKKFAGRIAVDNLSFTVPRGEIFGLLGHNGAGKSTAIGMMLGQVWPTSGEVKVCGHNIQTNRRDALMPVGAIFEAPVFYDYLSGARNLEILSTYTAPTSKARIREVIEWVGLTGREQSKVRTYSHGMRSRLALAQALLPKPELLILDEPSDGLDPEGIHEMRQTILRLQRELGLTILLSSHLLNEVEQLCTRIAVLQKGKKVFEGNVADVKAARGKVALKTNDFAATAKLLRERGLITATAEEKFITLASGHSTADVTQALVTAGIAVEGIWQHEQTVEDFYMNLIKPPPILPKN